MSEIYIPGLRPALARTVFFPMVLWAMLTAGCAVTNLQQVEVNTPAVQQPVRITDNPTKGDLTARGFFSYTQDQEVHTRIREHTSVNADGVYEVEELSGNRYLERAGVNVYPFKGNNFDWNVPGWQAGIELELPASETMAITGGLNFAESNTSVQLNQQLGLGFFFDADSWAYRFDFNLAFQQSRYNMLAVRGRDQVGRIDQDRQVTFIQIEDSDRYANPSFGVTFNSKYSNRPVNYFFNYTLGRQTFYDVKEDFLFDGGSYGADFRYSEAYNTIAAGIYTNVSRYGRMVLGFRWTKFMDEQDQIALFKLFVQYDVRMN